jgi:hypothetical protein
MGVSLGVAALCKFFFGGIYFLTVSPCRSSQCSTWDLISDNRQSYKLKQNERTFLPFTSATELTWTHRFPRLTHCQPCSSARQASSRFPGLFVAKLSVAILVCLWPSYQSLAARSSPSDPPESLTGPARPKRSVTILVCLWWQVTAAIILEPHILRSLQRDDHKKLKTETSANLLRLA